ncbi:MAG: hypothetical protein ACHP7N_02155 [Caulobacterales bacterium]
MSTYPDYAVLVLCAGDVDAIWHDLNPPTVAQVALPAPNGAKYAYVTTAYWTALAQLRCDDQFFVKGENCYYGLLLRCHTAFAQFQVGDYLVAVRGTMSQQEWVNDAWAVVKMPAPPWTGQVGEGFWRVYQTMTLNDLDGGNGRATPSAAIAAIVQAAPGRVFVTGHSLGAALATYLAADLQDALAAAAPNVAFNPYFFASPKPGTQDFVDDYQAKVATYTLVNYAIDMVPAVPPDLLGFCSLNGGGPSHDVHTIPPLTPGAAMPPTVQNNHSPVNYARMLDPANSAAKALTL